MQAPATLMRTHAIFAWAWLLVAIPFLTDAACNLIVGLFLLISWWLLAVGWQVLGTRAWPLSRKGRRWWLSAGLAGCLGPVLAFTDFGLVARVMLSRPWLDAYAAQVVPGMEESSPEIQRVGLFLVDQTEESDGAVLLYTSSGFINRNGIVYIPHGQSPPTHIRHVHHLVGQWHRFEWKF